MRSLNKNAVNTVNLSSARMGDIRFDICWVSATDADNRDTLTYRFHHHVFFELHMVTKGYITYGFENTDVTVKEGEYIIIPSGCLHKVAWHGESFGKLTLAFEPESGSETDVILRSLAGRVRKLPEGAKSSIDHALFVAEHKSAYRAELMHFALCGLILHISESAEPCLLPKIKDEKGDDRLLKAKMLIEDNDDIFFTCEDVANHCHMSVKQLGRLFKKYEGVGLLEYIHQKKLEASRKHLCRDKCTQKQIAEALGFSDVHYFSKFFTRMTGMTPTEFRKNKD